MSVSFLLSLRNHDIWLIIHNDIRNCLSIYAATYIYIRKSALSQNSIIYSLKRNASSILLKEEKEPSMLRLGNIFYNLFNIGID